MHVPTLVARRIAAESHPARSTARVAGDIGERSVAEAYKLCMYRKRINLSHALAGQRVGIKEVDEGIWIVSFMQHDLSHIDLEQKTLQPLDNPFGARLLPMS